jgi:ketosteroid isomerase-like protein
MLPVSTHARVALLLTACALLAACERETPGTPADTVTATAPAAAAAGDAPAELRAAIDAANRETSELIAGGNGRGVGEQYTADGTLMLANAPLARGREAVGARFQSAVDAGMASLTLAASEVEAGGDIATEVGSYRATGADGAVLDEGKYLVIWRREDGQWKRHRDIANSDLPPLGLEPGTAMLPAKATPAVNP